MKETLISGAIAGGIATGPMTVAMATFQKLRPAPKHEMPPIRITKHVLEMAGLLQQADQEETLALTGISHLGYGAASGAIYAALARRFGWRAVSGGIGFGLLVWLLGYQGWVPAMGVMRPASDAPADRNLMMIIAHIIWGLATGLLVERLVPSPPAPLPVLQGEGWTGFPRPAKQGEGGA